MGRFDGQTAIITGASRGIGLAIAQRLAAEGARVCVTARKTDELDKAVAELGGPERAMAVAGRADDVEHQAEAMERTLEAFGSVDLGATVSAQTARRAGGHRQRRGLPAVGGHCVADRPAGRGRRRHHLDWGAA